MRIELEEVDRYCAPSRRDEAAAAVEGRVSGPVCAATQAEKDRPKQTELLETLGLLSPSIMTPSRLVRVDYFPLTASGKMTARACRSNQNGQRPPQPQMPKFPGC